MSSWFKSFGTLHHGFGGRFKLGSLAPAEEFDEAVTLGQLNVQAVTSSTSNLFIQNAGFPAGLEATVPAHHNAIAYGEYTVDGDLTVDGEFRIVDWPS